MRDKEIREAELKAEERGFNKCKQQKDHQKMQSEQELDKLRLELRTKTGLFNSSESESQLTEKPYTKLIISSQTRIETDFISAATFINNTNKATVKKPAH